MSAVHVVSFSMLRVDFAGRDPSYGRWVLTGLLTPWVLSR